MADRQLLKRPAAALQLPAGVDRRTRPRLLLRCWAAPQARPQQRRGERDKVLLVSGSMMVRQVRIPPLRQSMATRPRQTPLPLAQAGRPRRPRRLISEISNRFNLRPQVPLMGPRLLVGLRPAQ